MWINPESLTVCKTHSDIRQGSRTSFPLEMTDAMIAEAGYLVVAPVAPTFDPLTQAAVEIAPKMIAGTWKQQWRIDALSAPQIEAADAERVAKLWQAAHEYEYAQVSGSAIGLLAIGVLSQKPKCLAVQAWIKGIWTRYYERKASGSADTNFSPAGPCPHSVPELMAELGL